MDCYYLLTDASTIYCIAMVLHPEMKLGYFCKQKWPGEWIEEVECLAQEKYVAKYEKVADESNMTPMKNLKTKNNSRFASFSALSVTTAPCASEILEYLKLPVENVKDPLKWWVDNQYVYPNLYHMALDYLSIPGKCGLRLHDDNSDTMFSYFYLCQKGVLTRPSSSLIFSQQTLSILNLGFPLLWFMGLLWSHSI